MDEPSNPLLTDLYQLNMMQAYSDHGDTGIAVFEFFMRKLPARRGFLMAAGLEQALDFLENLRFSPADIEWLAQTGRFGKALLDELARLRFTGDVHAMPEGTVFFADEPILRVTAPLPQAQLAETRLINILHFQSLIASKAARMLLAAPGKALVDFGLRRAHGGEAGLWAARASYIAGFAGTATVLAGQRYGIPIFGTMAHSFIQAYDDEAVAFENFARSRPNDLTLLIDTYDTLAAAHKVVALAPRLKADGITIRAVRIDSGDLIASSKGVRRIFDDAGLTAVNIFASGGLDEDSIAELLRAGAPINGFGSRREPHGVVRRAGARLRLQAAGICRTGTTQTVRRQGDVAGTQAGLASLRGGWSHGGRSHLARERRGGRRTADPIGHAGRPPDRPIAVARRHPGARGARSRTAAGAPAPAGAGRVLPGRGGAIAGAARHRGRRPSGPSGQSAGMSGHLTIGDRDALLVVDVQNDFCPGGALAVPHGNEVVPLINRLAECFAHVVLTQDWHPAGHQSFASSHPGRKPYETIDVAYGQQILWPDHCVQGTPGAELCPELQIPHAELVLRKGFHREIDSYSAFYENDRRTRTGLAGYLRQRGLRRIFLAGLAFDFCVRYSAEDAHREGLDVVVIEDACRSIDVDGSMAATREALATLGIRCISRAAVA